MAEGSSGAAKSGADESELLAAIRCGDEPSFVALVQAHHGALFRVARSFVSSDAIAEEVVQETWLAVIDGIHRFEQRSSLKTWLFRILLNQARNRNRKEVRSVPVAGIGEDGSESGPSVPAEHFQPDSALFADHWTAAAYPARIELRPEDAVLGSEVLDVVARAIDRLPAAQRQVITMRDMDHLSSTEVCDLLAVTANHQRVLLHRARSAVRTAVEAYWSDVDDQEAP